MTAEIAPAAATPNPTYVQPSALMPAVLHRQKDRVRMLRVVISVLLLTSCAGNKPPLTAAKDAVIDCGKVQRGALLGAVVEIGLMFYRAFTAGSSAPIDSSRIEELAVQRGADVGGCALAEFVKGLAEKQQPGVAVSALTTGSDPARVALERVRARLGGVRWQLTDGSVR